MRALATAHALLAALLAAGLTGPLSSVAGPGAALPALAALAGAITVLWAPLASDDRRPAGPLDYALVALAGLPPGAALLPLSAVGPREAALAAAVLLLEALLAAALARLPRARRGIAAGLLLALALSALLARFASTGLFGEERPWLRLSSPLELPAAALAPRRPGPEEAPAPRTNDPAVHVESATAGLFRRGMPSPITVEAPYFLGGESPWFEARAAGPLFPSFHDRPGVGGRVDWQPVDPDEPLRLALRPGRPERRRTADGWTVLAPAAPEALAVLEAFDDLPAPAPPAWRALIAARGGLPRLYDAAVDPERYGVREGPAFPPSLLRRRATLVLGAGALAALSILLLSRGGGRRTRGGRALLAVLVLSGGVALLGGARGPRAILLERAIVRALPGEREAAREDEVEVAAPLARAAPSFRTSGADGLTPILFRRPEPAAYAVLRDPSGEEGVDALPLPAGGRRLFRALAPLALAGPLEWERGRVLNRSGLAFRAWVEVARDHARLGGPLEDGAAQGPALLEGAVFPTLGALDAQGEEGKDLRHAIEREVLPRTALGRRFVVLVAEAALAARVVETDALWHERRPTLVVLALPD